MHQKYYNSGCLICIEIKNKKRELIYIPQHPQTLLGVKINENKEKEKTIK